MSPPKPVLYWDPNPIDVLCKQGERSVRKTRDDGERACESGHPRTIVLELVVAQERMELAHVMIILYMNDIHTAAFRVMPAGRESVVHREQQFSSFEELRTKWEKFLQVIQRIESATSEEIEEGSGLGFFVIDQIDSISPPANE